MTLFSEQVRILADESIHSHITTDYTQSAVTDWTTKATRSLTLTKTQFVYVKGVFIAGGGTYGAGRIRIDGTEVAATGGFTNTTKTLHIVVRLPAGTYEITWQVAVWAYVSNPFTLDELKIGLFEFADAAYKNYDGNLQLANGATGTIVNQTVTLPAVRDLPFGKTKQCTVIINAHCTVSAPTAERGNDLQNSEGTPASGRSGWRIYVDDVQQSWSEVLEDFADGDTSNPTYGEGSFGRLAVVKDCGSSFNLKVKAYNNRGATFYHYANVRVVACVWWIGVAQEPFTLDHSILQSTLYVTMEPVWANPTKYLNLGKVRIEDFSADYYSTTSGTGVVSWNYTFELVDPKGCQLFVSVLSATLWGSAITMWGIDLR